MVEGSPKNLALILSRQLASNLASAMFLIDEDGMLAYYNESAEKLVGAPFDQLGEITVADWAARLQLRDHNGEPVGRASTPPGIAWFEHRPAHQLLNVIAFDGTPRRVAVTAYPLFTKQEEFAGVVAIFWENGQAQEPGGPL
jgi:PAS domain-containing protein